MYVIVKNMLNSEHQVNCKAPDEVKKEDNLNNSSLETIAIKGKPENIFRPRIIKAIGANFDSTRHVISDEQCHNGKKNRKCFCKSSEVAKNNE